MRFQGQKNISEGLSAIEKLMVAQVHRQKESSLREPRSVFRVMTTMKGM